MSVKNKHVEDRPCRPDSIISDCVEPPRKHGRKSSTEYKSSVTILDLLEIDICCRAILDNLGLSEILRTECVCQRWRDSILPYIRDATRFRRPLYLECPSMECARFARAGSARHRRPLRVRDVRGERYERVLYKWGKSFEAVSCVVDSFPVVAELCPNLQDLVIHGIPKQDVVSICLGKFAKLEKVLFKKPLDSHTEDIEQNPDATLRMFLQKNTIKHLSVIDSDLVTGACFNELPTNLSYLRLEECPALDHQFLALQAPGLKTLELSGVPVEVLQHVHVLLDKTPNLEGLELSHCDQFQWRVLERLGSLRRLRLRRNRAAGDEGLRAARALRLLDVSYCEGVTVDGLLLFCSRCGTSLRQLGVAGLPLRDQDLENTIRFCYKLRVLDARDCLGLSSELVSYLAHILRRRGRRRLPRLTLRLRGTAVTDTPAQVVDARDCLGLSSELVPYLANILWWRGRRRLPRLTLRLRGTAVTEIPAQMMDLNGFLTLDFSDKEFSHNRHDDRFLKDLL